MVCATKFTNSTVAMLLRNESLSANEARSRTLHGCYIILKYAENTLGTIYASIPHSQPHSNISPYAEHDPGAQNDMYGPAVFVYTAAPREGLDKVQTFEGTEGGAELGSAAGVAPSAEGVEGALHVTENVSGVVSVQLTGVKRLGVAWLVLYKGAIESYKLAKFRSKSDDPVSKVPKSEIKKTWALILLLQTKIHALGLVLPPTAKYPLTKAEATLVEGNLSNGKELILNEISSTPDMKLGGQKGSRLLLSLLYLRVQQFDLRSALEFTEFLIRQSDVRKAVAMSQQDDSTKMSLLSLMQQMPSKKKRLPEAVISTPAVRHVVQSMARFMASYFGNKQMFVYPSHAVKKLPPLHTTYNLEEERIVALCRDDVTSAIIDGGLGEAWTSDKALEYLLLCGALPEAVWLARNVGDWKTAFLIGVASEQHRQLLPVLYAKKKKCHLPTELQPIEILKERLSFVIGSSQEHGPSSLSLEDNGNLDAITNSLNDFLLAGALCDLNLVPWLMETLAGRLKNTARKFSTLVPESLYLPAPPIYCPQPTPTKQSRIPGEVLAEIAIRHEVAQLVQLMLLVTTSAHCTLPAARWYAQHALEAFTQGTRFNKKDSAEVDIKVLQESFLNGMSIFQGFEKSDSIHAVLDGFREMLGVVWMLHCRDKLSLSLRKKSLMTDRRLKKNSSVTDQMWAQHCEAALTWARQMMPFRHFLSESDLDLCSILFSLVIEHEPTEESAKLLAEYFHDEEILPPEVQDKMQWLLKDWKRLQLVDRPKGATLSLYYEKVAQKYPKLLRKKRKVFGAYDQFVFAKKDETDTSVEVDDTIYVGSRPYESDIGFLKFMDEFYAVSFNKLIDQEAESQGHVPRPLLKHYSRAIRDLELNSMVHKAVTSFQRKQIAADSMSISRSRNNSPTLQRKARYGSRENLANEGDMQSLRGTPRSPRSRRGLFRSNSVVEVRSDDRVRGKPPNSPRPVRRSNSHTNLAHDENMRPITPITPRRSGGTDILDTSGLNCPAKHRTSTPRRPKSKTTIDQYATELENAQSLESVATSVATCDLIDDPLATPILEPWQLENMVFEERYLQIECLLDWLNRWMSRNHDFGQFDNGSSNNSTKKSTIHRQQSVLRIRVPPRVVLFSIWQLEHSFYAKLLEETEENVQFDEDATSRMRVKLSEESSSYESATEIPVPVEVVDDDVSTLTHGSTRAVKASYDALPQPLTKQQRAQLKKQMQPHTEEIVVEPEIATKDIRQELPVKKSKSSKKRLHRNKHMEHVIDDSTTNSDDAAVERHRERNRRKRTTEHGSKHYATHDSNSRYDQSSDYSHDIKSEHEHEYGHKVKTDYGSRYRSSEDRAGESFSDEVFNVADIREQSRRGWKRGGVSNNSQSIETYDYNVIESNSDDIATRKKDKKEKKKRRDRYTDESSAQSAGHDHLGMQESLSDEVTKEYVTEDKIEREFKDVYKNDINETWKKLGKYEPETKQRTHKSRKSKPEYTGDVTKPNGDVTRRHYLDDDDATMPRLTDAQRLEARRRKKLYLKHKTLDVLLNEKYVYDVAGLENTNQNNRNVSGASDDTNSIGLTSESTDVGTQISRAVTERMQEGPLGENASELIHNLSTIIDDEIDKTLPLLENGAHGSREISEPLLQSHTTDLEEALQAFNKSGTLKSQPTPGSTMDEPDGPGTSKAAGHTAVAGTLPFGGGLTDGGLTNRSDGSVIAEELRTVVRNELKKLIEAQHQGILAMLGSFDGEMAANSRQRTPVKKTTSFSKHNQIFTPHDDFIKPQECTVMTAQRAGAGPNLSDVKSASRHSRHDDTDTLALSTDTEELDITPLPSDELNTERSAADRPLTMSQLTEPLPSAKSQQSRNGQMNGVLKELKHLENKHSGSGHKHRSSSKGKENQPQSSGTLSFGSLNANAQGPPMGWMPLLHISPDRQAVGTRFPPIGVPQAWSAPNIQNPQPSNTTMPFMPLLRADYQQPPQYPGHGTFPYFRHEVPERDTGSGSGTTAPPSASLSEPAHLHHSQNQQMAPPPLLHADWSGTPFMHMRDQYAVPRLVPPEQLLDYEARKYIPQAFRKQQLQAEIDGALKQVAAERGRPQTPLGAKLLKADLEPFAEKDERDNEARQRRRNIKLTKPSDRKKKKKQSKEKSRDASANSTQEMSQASEAEDRSEVTEAMTTREVMQKTQASVQTSADFGKTADVDTSTLDPDALLRLHHGYAITPGMFDEYVDRDDELGSNAQNFARDQMQAQKLVKKMEEKSTPRSPRKRNAAVGTSAEFTHDQGTTISADTGTDPVGEALAKYYQPKSARDLSQILPPDIYMGLRFPDAKEVQKGTDISGNRGFLNVVDITGANMLAEIADSLPEREAHELVPEAVDMAGRPIKPHPNMTRGSPRRAPQSPRSGRRSPSPRQAGMDKVTAGVLGSTPPERDVDEHMGQMSGYGSRVVTRDSIRRRLGDMDTQIDAIEAMASNMQQDFRSTKLLLNTIDQIGETILPAEERYPTPRVTRPHGRESPISARHEEELDTLPSRGESRRSREKRSLEERLIEVGKSLDSQKLTVSGLSEMTDIIGEIVARGELEPEELGFSQKEANYMAQRYLQKSARLGDGSGSKEELEEIFRKKSPRRKKTQRTEAEQRELQTWMKEKRAKQMREYMQQRAGMREKEANPFTPRATGAARLPHTVTGKEIEEARKTRETNKSHRQRDFSKERERLATHLMRDILEDKIEDKLPPEVVTFTKQTQPKSARTPRIDSHRTSAPHQKAIRAASASPRGTSRTAVSKTSPERPFQYYQNNYVGTTQTNQLHQQRPHTASTTQRPSRMDTRTRTRPLPTRSDFSPMQPRKSLEFSGENQIHFYDEGESEEDIKVTQVIEKQTSLTVQRAKDHKNENTDKENEPRPSVKPYKPKPYTELVKMQHPEKTRKERDRSHAPVPYVERLSQMSSTFSTPRSQADMRREQQMIQGSKRMPGSSKATERKAPRSVKTYQQRLAEMKASSRTYTTPIVPRVHVPGGAEKRPSPVNRTPPKPRKQPMTYAQQLQALQPPKEMYRSGEGGLATRTRTLKKSQKPPHAAKTYVQQLQELQPHEARLSMEYYAEERVTRVRSRPYASPYADGMAADNDSVVSPWSMDDDVKHLIYQGEDASILEPSASVGTSSLDVDQLVDAESLQRILDQKESTRYSELVDPRDLEDIESLAGTEISAFIDWDQVDDIIADVHI